MCLPQNCTQDLQQLQQPIGQSDCCSRCPCCFKFMGKFICSLHSPRCRLMGLCEQSACISGRAHNWQGPQALSVINCTLRVQQLMNLLLWVSIFCPSHLLKSKSTVLYEQSTHGRLFSMCSWTLIYLRHLLSILTTAHALSL